MGNEPMTRASGAPEVEQQAPEPDLGALAPEHYSPEGIHVSNLKLQHTSQQRFVAVLGG